MHDDSFYDPAMNDGFYTPDSNELERPDWEDDDDYARDMAEQADREAAAERSLEEMLAESYDLRGDIREMIDDLPF